MKLSLTFLALAVATVQADLESQWNMNFVSAAKVNDVYTIYFDQIGDEMALLNMQAKVLDKECGGPAYAVFGPSSAAGAEVTALTVAFNPSSAVGANDGTVAVDVTVAAAEAAKSAMWTPSGIEGGGSMEFCVRYSLYTDNGLNEINYAETLITLTVTMEGGFTVEDFAVSEKDKETSTQTQAYVVEATLCADQASPFLQGSLICVNVAPSSTDVVVTSISDFTWTNGAQTQIALPTAGGDGLTSYEPTAPGTFSTILYAQFYETGTPVSGAGTANLGFAARRLGSDNGRALQELGAADAVQDFSIVADIVKSDDSPTALQTAGGATASFVVTIFGLVGAVLLA
jgi:hypothetical protein